MERMSLESKACFIQDAITRKKHPHANSIWDNRAETRKERVERMAQLEEIKKLMSSTPEPTEALIAQVSHSVVRNKQVPWLHKLAGAIRHEFPDLHPVQVTHLQIELFEVAEDTLSYYSWFLREMARIPIPHVDPRDYSIGGVRRPETIKISKTRLA